MTSPCLFFLLARQLHMLSKALIVSPWPHAPEKHAEYLGKPRAMELSGRHRAVDGAAGGVSPAGMKNG